MSDLDHFLNDIDIISIIDDISSRKISHGPYILEVHVTDRCNSGCYFCNQRHFRDNGSVLPLTKFKELISSCSSNGLRAIRFSGGGDPAMHPDILEMLDFVHNNNISVARFDTNGISLKPEISTKLIDHHLNILHVSLQAPTSKNWSKVTGLNPSVFDRVISNLRHFIEIDKARTVRIYVSFILDGITANEFDEMVEISEDLGVEISVHGLNSYTYAESFKDSFPEEIREKLAEWAISYNPNHPKKWSELEREIFCNPFKFNPFRIASSIPSSSKNSCIAPWTGALIKPNGDLYLCCALQDHPFGNIFNETLMDIWIGSVFGALRCEASELFFDGVSWRENLDDSQLHFLASKCRGDCKVMKGIFSHQKFNDLYKKSTSMQIGP